MLHPAPAAGSPTAPTDWDLLFGPSGPIASLPGYEHRPHQAAMARAVHGCLTEGGLLAVEAGTGTGKTLAYLLPILLSGQRVMVSTGTRSLQEQLRAKDVPLLARAMGRQLRAMVVKGRENYLCRRRVESLMLRPTAGGETDADGMTAFWRWCRETTAGDRAELADLPEEFPVWEEVCSRTDLCRGSKCPNYADSCFITRLRRAAAKADLVIVNHHLLAADAQLKRDGYGDLLPPAESLVIDEAHLLEDVAAAQFGVRASLSRIEHFFRDLSRELDTAGLLDHQWRDLADGAVAAARRFFRGIDPPEPRGYLAPLLDSRSREPLDALRGILEGSAARLKLLGETTEGMEEVGRRLEGIAGELAFIVAGDDPRYVYWVERGRSSPVASASPTEVGPLLKRVLFDAYRSVVMTSATLAIGESFDFFLERSGAAGAETLLLPSPFDYATAALLYLPTTLPEPNDPAFPEAVAAEMERLVRLSGGRALLLFTSRKNLAAVSRRLSGALPWTLLVQGEGDRAGLLGRFREETDSVLMGTRSFWQGIDVPGESLTMLVIDKLPFPSPGDPLNEARARHTADRGGNPFLDFALPQTVITLRQGLGRLLRGGADRGVLAILDHRIATRRYGKLIRRALPPCPVTGSLEEVTEFLARR